jgi:hypothetical protein
MAGYPVFHVLSDEMTFLSKQETFSGFFRNSCLYRRGLLTRQKNGFWMPKQERTLMEETHKRSHIWRFPAGERADTPGYRGAGVFSCSNKEKNASPASTNAGKVTKLSGISLITYLLFTRESNEAIVRGRSSKNRKSTR